MQNSWILSFLLATIYSLGFFFFFQKPFPIRQHRLCDPALNPTKSWMKIWAISTLHVMWSSCGKVIIVGRLAVKDMQPKWIWSRVQKPPETFPMLIILTLINIVYDKPYIINVHETLKLSVGGMVSQYYESWGLAKFKGRSFEFVCGQQNI